MSIIQNNNNKERVLVLFQFFKFLKNICDIIQFIDYIYPFIEMHLVGL